MFSEAVHALVVPPLSLHRIDKRRRGSGEQVGEKGCHVVSADAEKKGDSTPSGKGQRQIGPETAWKLPVTCLMNLEYSSSLG